MKTIVIDLQEKVLVMWTLHRIFMSLKHTLLWFSLGVKNSVHEQQTCWMREKGLSYSWNKFVPKFLHHWSQHLILQTILSIWKDTNSENWYKKNKIKIKILAHIPRKMSKLLLEMEQLTAYECTKTQLQSEFAVWSGSVYLSTAKLSQSIYFYVSLF